MGSDSRWVCGLAILLGCMPDPPPTEVPEVRPEPRTDPAATELEPEPDRAPLGLMVGSWNVRRLGQAQTNLDLVADVLDDFDLVAVQEVMTREVVDELRARMPDHQALLTDTPTPTEGTHREYFAFFYRPALLDPTINTFVPDPKSEFERDPYMACFDRLAASAGRLCLLTLHIVWGEGVAERKTEILALDDALRWAQAGEDASTWIVLGDFNRPVDDGDVDGEPESEWVELLDRRNLRAPLVLAGRDVPTTLGATGYANAYDHMFVSDDLAARIGSAGRIDLVANVCGGDFERCRREVSDHAPIFVRFDE